MRASWTGQISFGLVGIPVKAVPAQSSRDIRFELHHRTCHSRLETHRYCPVCEREVPADELIRAYEYSKNHYVWFEDDELEGISTPARHTLQILDFVELSKIDPVYYEKPYYLQPASGGERTYALLHRAMSDKGRVGIGKIAFRERESLAVIRPVGHALVLETIAWPDEVRALEEVVPPVEAKIDDRELQMADMLVETLTAEFTPEKYRDSYRDALNEAIESKVAGEKPEPQKAVRKAAKGDVVELMDLLRRSVAASGGSTAEEEKPEPAEEKAEPIDSTATRTRKSSRAAGSDVVKPGSRTRARPRRRTPEKAA